MCGIVSSSFIRVFSVGYIYEGGKLILKKTLLMKTKKYFIYEVELSPNALGNNT